MLSPLWLGPHFFYNLGSAVCSWEVLKWILELGSLAPAILAVKVLFMMVSSDWLAQYSAPPVVRAELPLNCEFMTLMLAPSP